MPKFTVHIERTAHLAVVVEADDAEQAEERACDVFPADPIGQYCTGWNNPGAVEVSAVSVAVFQVNDADGNVVVRSDNYHPDTYAALVCPMHAEHDPHTPAKCRQLDVEQGEEN